MVNTLEYTKLSGANGRCEFIDLKLRKEQIDSVLGVKMVMSVNNSEKENVICEDY